MDRKAQVRWFIIIVLIAIIVSLLYYPAVAKAFLDKLAVFTKPVTGYATDAADKAIHNIPK